MQPESKPETQPVALAKLVETTSIDSLNEAKKFLERWDRAFPGRRISGVAVSDATRLVKLKQQALDYSTPRTAEAMIMNILATNARPMNFVEIHAAQEKYAVGTIRQIISLLRVAGKLVRVREGYYSLPEHADAPFVDNFQIRSRKPKEQRRKKIRSVEELIIDFFSENAEGNLNAIYAWKIQRHPHLHVNASRLVEALQVWETQNILKSVTKNNDPKLWQRRDDTFREFKETVQQSVVLR